MTAMMDRSCRADRYTRQEQFAPLGAAGQSRLRQATALIVGVGGLGSWSSAMLARAGVGRLRLVDDDRVDWTNLARQAMYDEADAEAGRLKVDAAAAKLAAINRDVAIEAVAERATPANIGQLADGADMILDGSDDWRTRFVINDAAVSLARSWVWAGVVECGGQVMTVLPGETACLRCVYDEPPPPEKERAMKASSIGVLGPAVAMIAAVQTAEAVKILAGRREAVRRGLWQVDLWGGSSRQLAGRRDAICPCCGERRFDYLNA
jgi:adenylyltransferase/sulfurtransferase